MKLVLFSVLYGFGLPIVWVITFFAFVNCYFFKKLLLVYFYRKPPQMDSKIAIRATFLIQNVEFVGIFFVF